MFGKRLTLTLIAGLLATPVAAQDVNGVWQTEAGDTGGFLHVTIAPCGDKTCGTIRTAFDGDQAAITNYEHLGKQLIWDMTADGAGKWTSGSIWAPDRNKTYRSKMAISGDVLKVSGCVAGGLICRSQNWVRVK